MGRLYGMSASSKLISVHMHNYGLFSIAKAKAAIEVVMSVCHPSKIKTLKQQKFNHSTLPPPVPPSTSSSFFYFATFYPNRFTPQNGSTRPKGLLDPEVRGDLEWKIID